MILLLSIMVLVVGVSVVTGSGSGASDSSDLGRVPSLVADPLMAEISPASLAGGNKAGPCNGNASFDVYAAGFEDGDVVLITLRTETAEVFIGSGFPNNTGGFHDKVKVGVQSCGVLTIQAKRGNDIVTAPVSVVEKK